jgi:pyruvate dehydrogenase (quinone)
VKVNQYELVMPPTVTTEHLLHTVLYSAKAILSGHGSEVVQLTERNFLHRYAPPASLAIGQQKTATRG